MWFLEGFEPEAEADVREGGGGLDLIELAVVLEGAIGLPELEDAVEDFGGAGVALVLLDLEEFELGGDAAGADAEVEAAAGKVVEHGEAVGQHLGVVELEEDDAGAEPDVLGAGEGLGDEEVGGWRFSQGMV